ncbi:MAG: transglutaminase domain-containing protein [Bacteroidota bacterium]
MIKNTITFLAGICLLLIGTTVSAQEINDPNDPTQMDYTEVDRYVKSLSGASFLHVRDLVNKLTANFDTEAEKTRALFVWLTHNVSYDCGAEDKSEQLKGKDRKKWKEWKTERDKDFLPRVFKERKGAFNDFAFFFKDMCDSAGVTVRLIPGYGRNDETRIGKRPPRRPNHAWNAVRLNENWYLLDPTWAAGTTDCTAKTDRFEKKFGDHYYLTPPIRFIKDHLPEQEGWQLIDDAYDRGDIETFFLGPQVFAGYFKSGIDNVEPALGLLEMKEDTTIAFTFTSAAALDTVTVYRTRKVENEYTTEELDTAPLTKEGENIYTYFFTPPEKGRRFYLTFAIKGEDVVTYRVVVSTGT